MGLVHQQDLKKKKKKKKGLLRNIEIQVREHLKSTKHKIQIAQQKALITHDDRKINLYNMHDVKARLKNE